MNVYDFDKTIYKGDSSLDFYLFCLNKNKKMILNLPFLAMHFALLKLKITSLKKFKERFFSFLSHLENTDILLEEFWGKNDNKISQWYLSQKQKEDIIISASPEFLLKPICDKLGINTLIATDMDSSTGKITGENCKGEAKVRRILSLYPNIKIDNFYSDSYSDAPLSMIAANSYIVKGSNITEWSSH